MVPRGVTTFQGAWDCSDKELLFSSEERRLLKKKTKTIKSICRGNVNTACWVAVMGKEKKCICTEGIAGWSFRSCVSRQVTWGPGLQGAVWVVYGCPAQGLMDGGAPCSWPGRHSIPQSVNFLPPGWF